MPSQQFNFIKGDKVGSETDYRDALPVNMTAVIKDIQGVKGYMLQYPGLTLHATGFGRDRGGIWDARRNKHYRVSGERLIELGGSGEVTSLGFIIGSDTAVFAYSFNNLAIVASGRLYLYNDSAGLREVTDTDLGRPIDVCWIDQYLFFTDGENIYHSEITDESQIDPLDFATSEFSPDKTYGVEKTVDNRVMVFNRYSCEFYQNNASDNFAFGRLNGHTLETGIVGTHAKAKMNDVFYCVGNRKEEAVSCYILTSAIPQKFASREIEKIIGTYSETELRDIVVEAKEEDGYQHIIVHLPNHTLLFNQTVAQKFGIDNAWSILKSDVKGDTPYRGIYGVFDNNIGKWIYGDKQNSNIGILDEEDVTHYGNIAEWLLFTPYYSIETASIDEIDIQTIPGFTKTNDATVAVSLTFDGFIYQDERFLQYGSRGQHRQRLKAYRLGYVPEYVSLRLRGATRSRMAIGAGGFSYG